MQIFTDVLGQPIEVGDYVMTYLYAEDLVVAKITKLRKDRPHRLQKAGGSFEEIYSSSTNIFKIDPKVYFHHLLMTKLEKETV
jgi:hypothetical protein